MIFFRNGWGATSIDSLSTALIMGLQDVVDEVLDHVEKVDYTETDYMCSLFETTIRYLGGMISSYDLLKGPFSHMAPDVCIFPSLFPNYTLTRITFRTTKWKLFLNSHKPWQTF